MLSKKRNELVELQESSKHLKSQLKSKKKGIQTLETLLKDAGTRSRKYKSREASDSDDEHKKQKVVRPLQLKFFVVGPTGLCVEFNLPGSSTIEELRHDAKLAFISKSESKNSKGKELIVTITYQGRLLPDEATLDELNIRNGDSLVAVISNADRDDDDDKHTNKEFNNNDMLQFLSKQNELVATEMR